MQKVVSKIKIIEISKYNFRYSNSKSSFFVIVKCDPGPQKRLFFIIIETYTASERLINNIYIDVWFVMKGQYL